MTMKKKSGNSFVSSLMLLIFSLLFLVAVMYWFDPSSGGGDFEADERLVEKPRTSEVEKTGRVIAKKVDKTEPTSRFKPHKSDSDLKSSKTTVTSIPDKSLSFDERLSGILENIDNGNVDKAKEALLILLKENPDDERVLQELAMLELIDFQNSKEALKYLERAIRVNPENRIVLSELVGLYEDEGQTEKGLESLKSMYEENPDNIGLAAGIGQLLLSQGRQVDAIPYLEQTASQAENNENVLADLAEAYSIAGMGGKALSTYRKVIAKEKAHLEELKADGTPSIMGEESLNMRQMDYARELIRQNDLAEAEAVLLEVQQRSPDAEDVAALLKHLKRRQKL